MPSATILLRTLIFNTQNDFRVVINGDIPLPKPLQAADGFEPVLQMPHEPGGGHTDLRVYPLRRHINAAKN